MASHVDPETVEQTQELLTEKLQESGQLDKMQAMIIEASLSALKEEAGDSLFLNSNELKAEKASENGLANLSLVIDYLDTLGLLHTANVLKLEASLKDSQIQSRQSLQGQFSHSGNGAVLSAIVSGGAKASGSVSAASSPVPSSAPSSPPAPAAKKEEPANVPSKSDVSSSVAAILAKHAAANQDNAAKANEVPPQNSKSKETPYYISNWENRDFERRGQVKGQNIAIEDLKNCKIVIYDALDSMTMDACVDCELIVAACEGSIFIRECENVKITVACKQLRFRDCKYCPTYLFASTDPVVESSHHIDFYPFNLRIPGLGQAMKDCRLDPQINRFVHVYDFTEDDTSLPNPHFTVKYPKHGVSMRSVGEQHGTPEAPPEIQMLLEGKLEPAASSESGKNKSQNIKTGGAAWKASQDEEPEPESPPKTAPANAAADVIAAAAAAPAPKTAPANTLTRSSSSESYSEFEDSDDDDDEF